ncbi:protein SGT1 homolog B-like isoform X2 [Malania oleifera]|uniref:protein SGT1 homolog B-like isoform X2 n=1 Tax=Malania oleifera TaxID=397392 RepID=UPI0025AE1BBC|nr:protein SGT1 homolog B-like isoform X2 [Malania oleifera]
MSCGLGCEAVVDANKAIELDPSLAKAYLRKGTACFKLEEYQTAKTALETGAALAGDDSRFTKLIKECNDHLAERTSGTHEEAGKRNSTSHEIEAMAPVKPKYRHEYYQKPEEVVVTVFAKGIPSRNVVVDFGEQILSVAINVLGENVYHFQTRLFAKIIPDKCRYEVLSTKVEIHLVKAEAFHWTSLEFSKKLTALQLVNVSSVGSCRPTYPSSKARAKDWEKLEALVKKEEKDEKLDGDAAVNKLFRDIYQNADDDMRRAMSKFFVESNGTVLSTNWKDVGSKKVEGSPPDGMELKKWEY